MSLSPWDLTGNVSFSLSQIYRPRRPSYVFATQATRQRSGSYQHATGAEDEESPPSLDTDFIDNLLRRKKKQRSASVHQSSTHPTNKYQSPKLIEKMYGNSNQQEKFQLYFKNQQNSENSDYESVIKPLVKNQLLIEPAPLTFDKKNTFLSEKQPYEGSNVHYNVSRLNEQCFSPNDQSFRSITSSNRPITPDSISSITNRSSNILTINSTTTLPLKNKFQQSNVKFSTLENSINPIFTNKVDSESFKYIKNIATDDPDAPENGEISRKSSTHASSSSQPPKTTRPQRRYTKNLVVLSLGFILVFTAFRSVQNLQSSINTAGRLGVFTMSLVHATTFISCLFAPALVEKLSSKWTIVIGLLFYIFWIGANFWPHVATLIPSAIGVGFGQSLAWGAQVSYIEKLAVDYSHLSKELTQQELYKFNGIFLACFQSSHIWGNLISSLLLTNEDLADEFSEEYMDGGINDEEAIGQKPCGVYDVCNYHSLADLYAISKTRVELASPNIVKLMISYLVFASVGFLVIFFFLEKVGKTSTTTNSPQPSQGIIKGLKKLTKQRTYLFLTPLLIFNGFEQGFVYSDYTKSYIRCTVGVQYIGYNMITLGMTNSIFSIGIGVVSKHIAREAIVGIGCVLHLGLLVFLLVWIPGSNLVPVFFVISALWGLCDAIWQTQCNCLVNLSCPNDHDMAFQVFRMLQSIGATTAFLMSGFTCVTYKLYLLISLLVLAIIFYVLVEYYLRKQEQALFAATSITINNPPQPPHQTQPRPLLKRQNSQSQS